MSAQKNWIFLLMLPAFLGNFDSQAIAQQINGQRSEAVIIAQGNISTQWSDSRYSVQKTSFKDGRIEWIVRDTCQGLTCLSPLMAADFIDSDGVAIHSETVYFEGGNGTYRAYAKAPSSVLQKTVKVIVRNGV